MKVLFIFALIFAASTIVQADVEEGITTILNGFGTLFKDLGDLLQNPDKIKDLAHRFVGTLKNLTQQAQQKLEKLIEEHPDIIEKIKNIPKWSVEKLNQELKDDNDFAEAYALIQEDVRGSASTPMLGLGGFLAMTLFLVF